MSIGLRIVSLLLALTFSMAGAASGAEGETSPKTKRDEIDQWKPSVAFQVSIGIRDAESRTESSPITGPPLPDSPLEGGLTHGPPTVFVPAEGSATIVSPIVSGVFELMTPRLFEGAGSPRLFANIALEANRGGERDLAKAGVAGDLRRNPEDESNLPSFTETSIQGQGALQTLREKPFSYTIGAGLAFTLDLGERRVRIKPSAELTSTRFRFSNLTARVVDLRTNGDPRSFDDLRQISLGSGSTELFYSVGPAIEVETDLYRRGPILLGLYLHGSMSSILGSTKVSSTVTNEFDEFAVYEYRIDRWSYRVGTGIRVSWAPE